jgi:hypothetical protein
VKTGGTGGAMDKGGPLTPATSKATCSG